MGVDEKTVRNDRTAENSAPPPENSQVEDTTTLPNAENSAPPKPHVTNNSGDNEMFVGDLPVTSCDQHSC